LSARSVRHDTIVVERAFDASPARVFAAWTDPAARVRWDLPGDEWVIADREYDFRVGGRESRRFGPPGDPIYLAETHYQDIVPDARIVFTYTMTRGETRISVSLATVELLAAGSGTRMLFTEQAVFLDDEDTAAARRWGWTSILDNLDAELKGKDRCVTRMSGGGFFLVHLPSYRRRPTSRSWEATNE
jgi:uncharacterized protein YndB with AHSA1/START domain